MLSVLKYRRDNNNGGMGPVSGIRRWLNDLGLGQHAEAFEANEIDLELLPQVNDQVLKDIGVSSAGHRLKILAGIKVGFAAVLPASAPLPTVPLAQPALASASPEGERRQLTVLFCDMVGFTELANRVDPEVLQRIIRSYEDACAVCITRYEGYVFQRLGDGIVAFFGYPLAHEGEAERAIYAGLSIIDSLSKLDVAEIGRIQVRIGVATGVVVISDARGGGRDVEFGFSSSTHRAGGQHRGERASAQARQGRF
jgi:hypothetical protein